MYVHSKLQSVCVSRRDFWGLVNYIQPQVNLRQINSICEDFTLHRISTFAAPLPPPRIKSRFGRSQQIGDVLLVQGCILELVSQKYLGI